MATTFLKRQKEMKRLEKQREKAERRAQKKLAERTQTDTPAGEIGTVDPDLLGIELGAPPEIEPQS
ncbi:MAG: hypothetical protein P4N24_14700 [Acidobacteriota bacterium]|nr:hypothetical protein [Acidobacteriota bacterium]